MARLVFGTDDVRPLRTFLIDLVCTHQADGKSETEAIHLAIDDVLEAFESGEEWAPIATRSALFEYIRKQLRDQSSKSGPMVKTPGGAGQIRRDYEVANQLRLEIMAMTFQESRMALANQDKKATAFVKRVDRLRLLIDTLERLAPDALTLGDAAERLGMTAELVDLSDVMAV